MPGPSPGNPPLPRDEEEPQGPRFTRVFQGLRKKFHRAPTQAAIEADKKNKPDLIQADDIGAINLSPDIYDLVVVSAFGGVVQQHIGAEPVLVHPFFMFLLTLPMLVGQTTSLVYLNLDYDFTKPVHSDTGRVEIDKLLNILKLMMVMIVQLTMFTRILGSLRVLIFLLNPITWETVDRPWPKRMEMRLKHMFSPVFVAPWAILAILLHGILDYNICMDSVSIILYADSMKEAVYDSLAITFLADLGSQWWDAVSLIFHMEKLNHFQFRRASKERLDEIQDSGIVKMPKQLKNLWGVQRVGMTFRRVQVTLTAVIMMIICSRQALVICQAMDTNVLPVARDICSWYKFNCGEDESSVFTKFLWLMTESWLMVASPKKAIDAAGEKYCDTNYDRLRISDMLELPRRHPWRTVQLAIVVLIVLLAQVWYQFNREIRRVLYKKKENGQADNNEEEADPEVTRMTQVPNEGPSEEEKAALLKDEADDDTRHLKMEAEDLKHELHELNTKFDQRLAKAREEQQQTVAEAASTRTRLENSLQSLQERLAALEGKKGKKWF